MESFKEQVIVIAVVTALFAMLVNIFFVKKKKNNPKSEVSAFSQNTVV